MLNINGLLIGPGPGEAPLPLPQRLATAADRHKAKFGTAPNWAEISSTEFVTPPEGGFDAPEGTQPNGNGIKLVLSQYRRPGQVWVARVAAKETDNVL